MLKNYKIIDSLGVFNEAKQHILDSELIAFDTETTGLNTRKDKVIGYSFSGSEGVGYYLPLYEWKDEELKSIDSLSDENLLLMLLTKKLIMHNASFDCRMIKSNFDIDLVPSLYCDTILLKHAVDEERPFGLKDIAKKIQDKIGLDVEKSANEEQIDMLESIKANGGSVTKDCYELYKADMRKIGIYACADTDLTLRIFNYYSKILKIEGLEKFFYVDETMPLLKEVTIPMESGGIPVDVKALETAKIDIESDIEKLEEQIQKAIQPNLAKFEEWYLNYKFPPRRSGEFAQALARVKNLNLPLTDSGRFSLSKSSLEHLDSKCPYRDFLLGGDYLSDEDVELCQRDMFSNTGEKYMFMLSSKHHLKKLFFEILGEEPISRTKKGNPQVDNLFLTINKDKYEWVGLLLDYNKLCKIRDSYINRFLDKHEEGMFYPSFFQHRTISGRYGGDLMQLSRPYDKKDLDEGKVSEVVYKYTNMIRKFFISGKGFLFCDADYESLEPHVFAHVSGDQKLKDIFIKGHDFYSTIAIDTESLQNVSADKKASNYLGVVNSSRRQNAKPYALGIPYGMEDYALHKKLEIPQEEARRLISNYLNAYPELAKWMDRSNQQCKDYGLVKTEAGRIRHMPTAKKIWYAHGSIILDSLKLWKKYHENPKKYEQMKYLRKQMVNYLNNAKNFQIQSLAASITNRSAIAIAREIKRQGLNAYLCANVHDQLIVRVSEIDVDKVAGFMEFLMCNSYTISIPLKAPVAIGDNFYDTH